MKKNKATERKFGGRDKFGYMMGDFGCNMSFQLISSWLLLFVTTGCGLDPTLFGILIIVAKVFDAINDPIIGNLVDSRKPGKHGKYKPWLFWGAIAIAFTTTLLFVDVRGFSQAGLFAYFLIMYCLWSIAYTSANVPYGSLNASLTDDPGERSSLSSLRSIGAGFAMLPIITLVPALAVDKTTGLPKVEMFFWVALVCGIVGIGGFLLTIFLTKEKDYPLATRKEKVNYFKTLKNFFKNRSVVAISLASLVQLICILSYSLTIPYVYPNYFNEAKMSIGMVNILIMLPMMIFIPIMGKLSVKYGKKEISAWPNVLGLTMFAAMFIIQMTVGFPRNATGAWIYTIMYMIGMMSGGTFMLATWSMVADCVDQQEIQSGKREEASVYATYSFARKVAQGIGAGLVSMLIGACGYVVSTKENPLTESELLAINTSEKVASGMLNVAIILPLIGFALIFVILLFMYNLDKKTVNKNTTFLHEKHQFEAKTLDTQKVFYEEENK